MSEGQWVKGSLAGKLMTLTKGSRTLHTIEAVDPKAYKVRTVCGAVVGFVDVKLKEATRWRKRCVTCEAKR